MKNLLIRSASGIVFVALMVAAILIHQYTFLAIMTFILAGSLMEFYNITASRREPSAFKLSGKWFLVGLFVFVYLVSFVLASEPVRAVPNPDKPLLALFQVILMQRDATLTLSAIIPCLFFLLFTIELFNKTTNPFVNIGWNLVAISYLLIPMVLTNNIYFAKGGAFLVAIFGLIWLYDAACYALGSVLGRTPLFQRVSPKKTWEGLIGGSLITLAAAYFLLVHIPGLDVMSKKEWLILTIFIIPAATLGDLVESLLKRSLEIKDSGSIMPGHGGFLDRFDAYFFTVPFVWLLLWLFAQGRNLLLLIEYIHN
jgi:phosphatidate cytidylyltransferase